jgi:hypothetical protein
VQRDGIVFVLGAGASYSENAPLTSDLLFETLTKLGNDEMIKELKEFLRDFFQININCPTKKRLPTFEEALTMVDIALERQEDFSESLNNARLNAIRDSLIYSMATIVDESLPNKGKFHDPFINNIYDLDKNQWRKVSFINLNYDLLLDNAIVSLYERKDLDLDYGIDFRNFVPHIPRDEIQRGEFIYNIDDWAIPREGQSILLLKPHGSLNWLYCPTCNTIKTTKTEKGNLRVWRMKEKCIHDGSYQKILLVPPTWGNSYENSFLTRILAKTDETLRKAGKVFFVGCSLSDYDIKLKYLLKRALYTPASKTQPKITVIQNKKETEEEKIQLEDRYCRFFGKNISFNYQGFEYLSAHVCDFFED